MTKLSDTQLVLLSTAANRADSSLVPPAASVTARADHIRRSIEALIRKQLAHEFKTEDAGCFWRRDGDTCFGVIITDAGRTALAMVPPRGVPAPGPETIADPVPASMTEAPPRAGPAPS
jgi:hypothetical protein